MTKTEIKEKLDSLGIEYDETALKEELEELLESAEKAMKEDTIERADLETIKERVAELTLSKEEKPNPNADFNMCFQQMVTGLPFKKEE